MLFNCRDINKTVKVQEVDSAKAEERLLNLDFVKEKSKDLYYRNKKAEVCFPYVYIYIYIELCLEDIKMAITDLLHLFINY